MVINQLTTIESIKAKTKAYNARAIKPPRASFSLPTGYTGRVFVSKATMAELRLTGTPDGV